MDGRYNTRQKKAALAFGIVSAMALADTVRTGVKIATTPLDPLGFPKLPFRLVRFGLDVGVCAGAGFIALARLKRDHTNQCIRKSMSPEK